MKNLHLFFICLFLIPSTLHGGDRHPGLDRAKLFTADPQTLDSFSYMQGGLGGFICEGISEASLHNQELFRQCTTYQDLVEALTKDLEKRAELMKEHRWHIEFNQTPFDPNLLKSAATQFVLVGVIARPDDASLPGPSPCGELRFVFRLFGRDIGKIGDTFMPATVMVALRPQGRSSCRKWMENPDLWSIENLKKLKKSMESNLFAIFESFFCDSDLAAGISKKSE